MGVQVYLVLCCVSGLQQIALCSLSHLTANCYASCSSPAVPSLNAFVVVYARGLDLAPGGRKKREQQVTLRELQKRVSGNAQDYEEVIKKAKRQSSTTGTAPASSVPPSVPPSIPGSKRGSTTGNTVPPTPGECIGAVVRLAVVGRNQRF